jgi:hypothetical protein
MGLFWKNKNEKKLFLLFPDGSEVSNQSDIDRLLNEYSFTPSTLDKWRLQNPDIDAIASASAKLWSIGFNDEPIVAFGPVLLRSFPKAYNEYIADAVLTSNYLVIYYQKGILKPDFLILPILNISGITGTGPWSAQFNFKNGIHQEKSGTFEMAETFFELSERLGKDGHANRRSVTFMRSLADTLTEIGKSRSDEKF